METLRAQVDTVEPVSLDEAYLDLTGVERPNAAGRRIKAAVTRATGLACSIGIGPEQAGGQGGVRRRQAGRLPDAHCRAGAGALRGLPSPADPRDRPQDRRQARAARHHAAGPAGRAARPHAVRLVRHPAGTPPGGAGPVRGRPDAGDRPGAQVRVAGDHLRHRPARPGRDGAGAGRPGPPAVRGPPAPRAQRAHRGHQGAHRRLPDPHAGAHAARAREHAWTSCGRWRWTCCGRWIRPAPSASWGSAWPAWRTPPSPARGRSRASSS